MGKKTADPTEVFEKLGAFYLGRVHDAKIGETTPDLVLYDAKDLTTHAVCVGMTGSGKTGLCLGLLEEAAIDGIPAIAIDPKGDLGNLLLTFPELRPSDFRPWIDEREAARKGMPPDDYSDAIAKRWREGLAEWGQSGGRIQRLRDAVDLTIYTPGSSAGLPLSILTSLAAPPPEIIEDADALRERIAAAVSGILALIKVDADPITSREHILLSNLFDRAWREARDLDLARLIQEIQQPPLTKIGVMDVDTFFPPKDRMALSLRLNNLLASPEFASWMEGEPLDVKRLLWTAEGKPRVTILSIAHLSDPERMFFVTLLLNEVIAWMRAQSGTSSLRALLYMDEVFGFFPPTANPPSKTPMLTLLKQARAFGVGVVLATQNPVDLDYKGLSNAGTWFLGRLQTERDKERVLEGLEGASAAAGEAFDRQRVGEILAGLKSRVFLMNNVHENAPVLFHTRWVMSYLRGPLTRIQIQTLMAPRKAAQPSPEEAAPSVRALAEAMPHHEERKTGTRPVLAPDIPEYFQPVAAASAGDNLVYRPALLGAADLHYANARLNIDEWHPAVHIVPLGERVGTNVWEGASTLPDGEPELLADPEDGIGFATLPKEATNAKRYTTWTKRYKTHLYQTLPLTLYQTKEPKLVSKPGESEADFRVRVREAARERRDETIEKLRKRYAPKLARLEARIQKASRKVQTQEAQYQQAKAQTVISVGATVLGALFGRKAASVGTVGRASTAMRGVGRASREKGDIERAKQELAEAETQLEVLEVEFEQELADVRAAEDAGIGEVSEKTIAPRKTDITIGKVALVWTPWRVDDDGIAEPAYL
ncbi:MAG: ATP-binding protein [Gemmatimonadales bacterium]|nr:ATP-binding protein [Gemmatimonadales bacterium]